MELFTNIMVYLLHFVKPFTFIVAKLKGLGITKLTCKTIEFMIIYMQSFGYNKIEQFFYDGFTEYKEKAMKSIRQVDKI